MCQHALKICGFQGTLETQETVSTEEEVGTGDIVNQQPSIC